MNLTARELATALAGLRLWQLAIEQNPGIQLDGVAATSLHDVATDGGTLSMMQLEEIDALCEKLNCSPDSADSPDIPTDDQCRQAVQTIREILWLTTVLPIGLAWYPNKEKDWDMDTLEAIAGTLEDLGLKPAAVTPFEEPRNTAPLSDDLEPRDPQFKNAKQALIDSIFRLRGHNTVDTIDRERGIMNQAIDALVEGVLAEVERRQSADKQKQHNKNSQLDDDKAHSALRLIAQADVSRWGGNWSMMVTDLQTWARQGLMGKAPELAVSAFRESWPELSNRDWADIYDALEAKWAKLDSIPDHAGRAAVVKDLMDRIGENGEYVAAREAFVENLINGAETVLHISADMKRAGRESAFGLRLFEAIAPALATLTGKKYS